MPLKMFYTRFRRSWTVAVSANRSPDPDSDMKSQFVTNVDIYRIPNASEPNQYAKIDRFTLFCYVDIVVNVTFNRELKIKYINIYRKKSRIESWQEGSKQMKQIPKSCPKSN